MNNRIPVLDDNTRNASIIGHAETANEAAEVYAAYLKDRMDPMDYEALERPVFARRFADSLAAELRDECPAGAFEPLL